MNSNIEPIPNILDMYFISRLRFVKLFTIISAFIATTILGFLFLGCVSPTSMYSSVYLAKIEYNDTSELYPRISTYFKSINNTGADALSITLGYNGGCIEMNLNSTCYSYAVMTQLLKKYQVPVVPNAKLQLDIIQLSLAMGNSYHPNVLITTIIMMVAQLLFLCYCSLPKAPGIKRITMAGTILATIISILWGFGSMLQHEAVTAAAGVTSPASMDIVILKRGIKADAMTWSAFSFIVVVNIGSVVSLIHILTREKNKPGVFSKA